MIAFHMDELQRGFIQGDLHDNLVENVDETHFIVHMDNGRTLGFRGDDVVKYVDVVSGGLGMTMVVRVSSGSNGIIHSPFMIFQNDKCSYPIRGCPDNVLGVSYRTAKKGFMTGIIWNEWLNEVKVVQNIIFIKIRELQENEIPCFISSSLKYTYVIHFRSNQAELD